jgi:5'-3' exonuclease
VITGKPVFFDASWLMHRAKHTMGELSHEGMATGITFGFFQQLLSVCNDPHVRSNRVGIFFDSRHSYRRDFYPPYKSSRGREKKSPEDWSEHLVMGEQSIRLRKEILPACGFPVYQQWGLESDDLLASAAEQSDRGDGAVIVTADGDLYQCITTKVHWFDPQRVKYLDHLKFWALKHLDPDQWATVKAICGCDTDEVAGIDGVGEKGAIDYVLNTLPETGKKFASIASPEGQSVIARNLRLVKLPHRRTRPVELVDPEFQPERFFKWCEKLGFASYLDGGHKTQWEMFFDGNFSGSRILAKRKVVRK